MNKENQTKKRKEEPSPFTLHPSTKKGFTLIELMVASSIFIIVMVISIGAVLSIVDANRKAQSLNSVINNLNFAVESMVRDMREGKNFCDSTLQYPCDLNSISFYNSKGEPVRYFQPKEGKEIDKTIIKDNNETTSSLTSSEVVINSMDFYVTGNGDDSLQPIILLTIGGTAGSSNLKTKSNFQLQTLITERLLDHPPQEPVKD